MNVVRWVRSVPICALTLMSILAGGERGGAADLPKIKLEVRPELSYSTLRVFSPDGKVIVGSPNAGAPPMAVSLWDANTGKFKKTLGTHTDYVRWTGFSRDGKTLATYSNHGNGSIAKIWNMPAGTARASIAVKEKRPTIGHPWARLSPDGKLFFLAVVRETGTGRSAIVTSSDLVAWDTKTGKEVWRLDDGDVMWGDVSPDGKKLVVYAGKLRDPQKIPHEYEDSRILVIDTANGKPLKTHALGEDASRAEWIYSSTFAVLPDNRKVACFDTKGMRVRDIDSGKVENEVKWAEVRAGNLPPVDSFGPQQVSIDGKTLLRRGRYKVSDGQTGLAGDGFSAGQFGECIELREMSSGKVIGLQTHTSSDDPPLGDVYSPNLKKMAATIGTQKRILMIVDISKLDSPPAP